MNEYINRFIDFVIHIGPVAGIVLIILESIIPVLPLGFFIALNDIIFGNFLGFIISWISTLIGCSLAFYLVRKGFSKRIYVKSDNSAQLKKIMKFITTVNFVKLTLIVALPFTPAFLVNIAAGLSKMKYKKFLASIIIGKLSIVYFWGYVGTSFLSSFKNPIVLIELSVILLIAYFLSVIVCKKFNIK